MEKMCSNCWCILENNVTNSDDRAIVLMHSTLLINVNLCDIGKVRKQFFLRNDKGYFKNQ